MAKIAPTAFVVSAAMPSPARTQRLADLGAQAASLLHKRPEIVATLDLMVSQA